MFGLPPSVRIHFATDVVDMRNGIDGLRVNDVNYTHPSTTTTSPHPVERPTFSASLSSG